MRFFARLPGGACLLVVAGVLAAEAAPAPAATPVQVSTAAVTGVPLSEIAPQAESVSINLQDMDRQLSSDVTLSQIQNDLPVFRREFNARFEETSQILSSQTSLEILRGMEKNWRDMENDLKTWEGELARRATQFDQEIASLDPLRDTWTQTLNDAQSAQAPPTLIATIQNVLTSIGLTRARMEKGRGGILTLQNRVGEEEARAMRMISALQQAQREALDHLFVRDSPVIWNTPAFSRSNQTLLEQSQGSFHTQARELSAYVERRGQRVLIHLLVFGLLLAICFRARRQIQRSNFEASERQDAARIFETPITAAGLLALIASVWIYPHAPRMIWAFLSALAMIPAVLILRRLVERRWHPLLYALVVFYFVDQVRQLVASLPLLARALFLAEMTAGFLILVWHLLRKEEGSAGYSKAMSILTQIGAGIFAVSAIAVAVGYVNLANLLGHALLGSAYWAVILYGLIRLLELLWAMTLVAAPLTRLSMVREDHTLFWQRGRFVLEGAAICLWVLHVLGLLALRQPLLEYWGRLWVFVISLGSIKFTVGNLISFGITLWAAFMVSRFIRFVLQEEVYSRFELGQGLPYAISTTLHYSILAGGFLLAIAALGVDMTKFTILAGAFGVGVGFGTQNIINNFVSGLILLFERPVKVGDMIQIADASGVVQRIGIRATIIRTATDSDVIVPNANLISNEVINWTLTDRQRRADIPVSVAGGTDPQHVIELLQHVAAAHPLVSKNPPPQATLEKLSTDEVTFTLRVWTPHYRDLPKLRSDLTVAIHTALASEKVAVH